MAKFSEESWYFRVTLNLHSFIQDYRTLSRLYISPKLKTINDLKLHISKHFNVADNFYLSVDSKYIPECEDVRVLKDNDIIDVLCPKENLGCVNGRTNSEAKGLFESRAINLSEHMEEEQQFNDCKKILVEERMDIVENESVKNNVTTSQKKQANEENSALINLQNNQNDKNNSASTHKEGKSQGAYKKSHFNEIPNNFIAKEEKKIYKPLKKDAALKTAVILGNNHTPVILRNKIIKPMEINTKPKIVKTIHVQKFDHEEQPVCTDSTVINIKDQEYVCESNEIVNESTPTSVYSGLDPIYKNKGKSSTVSVLQKQNMNYPSKAEKIKLISASPQLKDNACIPKLSNGNKTNETENDFPSSSSDEEICTPLPNASCLKNKSDETMPQSSDSVGTIQNQIKMSSNEDWPDRIVATMDAKIPVSSAVMPPNFLLPPKLVPCQTKYQNNIELVKKLIKETEVLPKTKVKTSFHHSGVNTPWANSKPIIPASPVLQASAKNDECINQVALSRTESVDNIEEFSTSLVLPNVTAINDKVHIISVDTVQGKQTGLANTELLDSKSIGPQLIPVLLDNLHSSTQNINDEISSPTQKSSSPKNTSHADLMQFSDETSVDSLPLKKQRKRKRTRKRKPKHVFVPDMMPQPIVTPVFTKSNLAKHIRFNEEIDEDDSKSSKEEEFVNVEDNTQEIAGTKPCQEQEADSNIRPDEEEESTDREINIDVEGVVHIGVGCENLTYKNIVKYPIMKDKFPKAGDIIAFKMCVLSASYTPEISDVIVAMVLDYDTDNTSLGIRILEGVDQCLVPEGKFYMDEGDERCDELRELFWGDLIEPRLLFP